MVTVHQQPTADFERADLNFDNAPASTASESATREAFYALMWAFSYPGRIYTLPPMASIPLPEGIPEPLQPLMTIGHTLLDLEVSYFTPIAALDQLLAHTAARSVTVNTADYHFYPYRNFFEDEAHLALVAQAKTGDMLYPDRSATLIIACRLGDEMVDGQRLRLTGPGIQTVNELTVAGIPPHFWALRAELIHYPLGFDLILVDDRQVVGLPRTTVIA